MPELDPTQRQAIESSAGTVMVTGPPGSGKTTSVIARFEHLIESRGVPYSDIAIFTFSAGMAKRLQHRIEQVVEQVGERIGGGSFTTLGIFTYHSFAAKIISEHALSMADPENVQPTLIDPFKEFLIVKELLAGEKGLVRGDLKNVASKDGFAREIADFFGRLKRNLIGPDEFAAIAGKLTPRLADIARVYSRYSEYNSENHLVGPGDTVAFACEILRANPKLSRQLGAGFTHVLADEFQEVDPAQLSLIEALTSEDTSLFLAGDEDQRIYRFRGSMIDQFSRILALRPDAQTFKLTKSYRLASEIETASQRLIAINREGHVERSASEGCVPSIEDVEVKAYSDSIEQAYDVARTIKSRVLDGGLGYSDFAILCRSTARSAPAMEEALSYYDVPYVLYNSTSFHRHPMVRGVAAFVRLLLDPADEASLLRVLGLPSFGIDAVALSRLMRDLERPGGKGREESLLEILRSFANRGSADRGSGVDPATLAGLRGFFGYFEEIQEKAHNTDCPSALIHGIMQDLFFSHILRNEDTARGARDAGNLRTLHEAVDAIESVIGRMRGKCGLAEVAVGIEHAFAHYPSRMENDPAEEVPGGVAIMTVHQAKGLEFPYVYLVDMTDEFFPRTTRETALLDAASDAALKAAIARNEREVGAPDSASGDSFMDGTSARLMPEMEEQLREERRLAYVALTRAAKGMVICHAMESGLSEPVSLSPFACEFLGRAADDDPAVADNVADRPEDCRSRLREAMNRQEIESALRECVQTDGGEAVADEKFSRNLESLDLDAAFITTQSPFEPEDNLPLDLSERVYSASQLRSYLECPRQYYFEKILRLAPERVEDFGLGQLVHKALEVFHEEVTIISGDPVALEKTMEGALRSVWEGGASREGFAEKYQTALQRFAVEQRASEILKRYLLTEIEEAPGREIASCEETVSFDIDEFNFVARIDRIDRLGASDPDKGRHVIIDYKTSATTIIKAQTIKKKFINVDEKPEYRPTDFQMPLYLLAARSAGYEPVELSYYWLSQQNTDGKFKKGVLPVAPAGEDAGDSDSLTDAELELATENILSVTRKISAGLFEPSPDKAYSCSRCAFAAICTIGEEGFDGD